MSDYRLIDELCRQEAQRRGIPVVDRTDSEQLNDADATTARVAAGYENAHKKRRSRNGRKDALREALAARSDSSQDVSGTSRLGVVSMAGDGYRF